MLILLSFTFIVISLFILLSSMFIITEYLLHKHEDDTKSLIAITKVSVMFELSVFYY